MTLDMSGFRSTRDVRFWGPEGGECWRRRGSTYSTADAGVVVAALDAGFARNVDKGGLHEERGPPHSSVRKPFVSGSFWRPRPKAERVSPRAVRRLSRASEPEVQPHLALRR